MRINRSAEDALDLMDPNETKLADAAGDYLVGKKLYVLDVGPVVFEIVDGLLVGRLEDAVDEESASYTSYTLHVVAVLR